MGVLLVIFILLAPTAALVSFDLRDHLCRVQNHRKKITKLPTYLEEREARAHEYQHREDEKKFWRRSVNWSIATLAVAISALIIAFFTFDDTHSALIAVQRAFIYPADVTYKLLPQQMLDRSVGWGVTPWWENSGNTPAKKVAVHTLCAFTKSPLPNAEDDLLRQPGYESRVIGPHQKVEGETCAFDTKTVKEALSEHRILVFSFTAKYFDVFDKPHITRGCRKGIIIGNANPNNISAPIELGTIFCKTMNCADEQCEAEK